MNKRTFDMIFIFVSAAIFIILLEFGLIDKYKGFLLIPILIAYQLGQYSVRRANKKRH